MGHFGLCAFNLKKIALNTDATKKIKCIFYTLQVYAKQEVTIWKHKSIK